MAIGEFLFSLPDLINRAVEANEWVGYGAILVAMFLENIFPPIPSELIMPLGGFYISQGQLNFFPVVLSNFQTEHFKVNTILGKIKN